MAFVLTGITGLLSGALSTTRSSADDNALTLIRRNVVEYVRGRSLDDLSSTVAVPRFFTEDGNPCTATNDSDAIQQHTLYRCVLSTSSDPDTASSSGTINMVTLNLRVTWPMTTTGTASERNSRNIYVKFARY